MTQRALKLAPHAFVRPEELRQAEWEEINLEASIWKIAASKMTMREPHMVPLSRHGIAMLKAAQAVTGRHRYVFAPLYPANGPCRKT